MAEIRRMREVVETLEARLRLVEERQDFADRLLEGSSGGRVVEGRRVDGDPERHPLPDDAS